METGARRRTWIETLKLVPPSLSDNTADQERLFTALQKRLGTTAIQLDLDLARALPDLLRRWDYAPALRAYP